MNTYDSYLKHEAGNILTMEEALEIYENLVQTVHICKSEDKDEFVNEMIEKATKYTNVRANWEVWDREKRINEDRGRSIMHNAFIDSLNILARLLKADGIETPWRDQLGDHRKRIGDFACFLVYMIGIQNR